MGCPLVEGGEGGPTAASPSTPSTNGCIQTLFRLPLVEGVEGEAVGPQTALLPLYCRSQRARLCMHMQLVLVYCCTLCMHILYACICS